MTAEDLLKAAPAVVGAAVATIRVLPSVATALRRRRFGARTGLTAQLTQYKAPLPWSPGLHRRLTGETTNAGLRRRSMRIVLILGVACLVLESAYLLLAAHRGLPEWSVIVSVAVMFAVLVGLGTVLTRLVRDEDQLTGAVPQQGSAVVKNLTLEDVAQRALGTVAGIGARVITFDGTTVHAATGVQLAARLFIGEHIKVHVSQGENKIITVSVESIKLDYVTPSRSRRNVLEILEAWLPVDDPTASSVSQPVSSPSSPTRADSEDGDT